MPQAASPPRPQVIPAHRRTARLVATLATTRPDDFTTAATDGLALDLDGIAGDRHVGHTRGAGPREHWYARGTPMRNRRQLSVISVEEMETVAAAMDLPRIAPEWIGANLVLQGVPLLTFLPPGTRLHFPGGAVVLVEHMNEPCRKAGRGIAAHFPERSGLDLAFAKAAFQRRGVVATVDCAGLVRSGETAEIHVPAQWIYPSGP